MKQIIYLRHCLTFILFNLILSVSSFPQLSPNSLIYSQYFSITSPKEEEWNLISESNPVKSESIFLQKGHGPGNLSQSDYPIKTLIVMRRIIENSQKDNQLIRDSLYENLINEIKKIVDTLSQRFYVDEYLSKSFYSDEKLLYQFTYTVSFTFDSSDPNTPPIPNLNDGKIILGNGIGQYYFYLPIFYREWSSYYLFLFDQYPEIDTRNSGISGKNEGENYDSIKVKIEIPIKIKNELSEFINGFTCIEDTLKK